mgnify:CR=1 FL=1|tara:strand:- start:175 stop:462 length:288 start_codon:yes stop_codon:yes gene_type:complete
MLIIIITQRIYQSFWEIKHFRGKGIGYQVWNLTLNTLLEELNFRMVSAGTMEINLPMVKLLKKSQMSIHGLIPKKFLWNGTEIGMVYASIQRNNI